MDLGETSNPNHLAVVGLKKGEIIELQVTRALPEGIAYGK